MARDAVEGAIAKRAALAVLRMPTLYWSDLGTPKRVIRAVKTLSLDVPRLAAFDEPA